MARRAVEILRGCDLVKFARLEVAPEALAGRADAALAVATEIERHRRPKTDAGGDGAPRAEAAA